MGSVAVDEVCITTESEVHGVRGEALLSWWILFTFAGLSGDGHLLVCLRLSHCFFPLCCFPNLKDVTVGL
jgi:hypothetical protein